MLEPNNAKIDHNYFSSVYNEIPDDLPKKILILDTTLREGEQSPGVSFTIKQRLQIAWTLDYFGVNAIEISPIISEDHKESCKKIIKMGLSADIVAHLRALPQDIDVALDCDAKWIAVYHSVSDVHLKHKLRVSREETKRRSVEAVEYAKKHGLKMRFTMEDASRADPLFLVEMCKEISKAGVDRISLPDTLGTLRPIGMYNLVKTVMKEVEVPIDMHCHNDLGLAAANSLAGMEAGATQIHVTINGLGERTGIPSLAEISVALSLIYQRKMDVKMDMLKELSELLERHVGIQTHDSMPLVGKNAYRHKAGTHVAAIIREPAAYEITPPRTVGNSRKIIFGELSGRNEAAFLLRILGLNPTMDEAFRLTQGLKKLRCGDLFELTLSEELEKELIKT